MLPAPLECLVRQKVIEDAVAVLLVMRVLGLAVCKRIVNHRPACYYIGCRGKTSRKVCGPGA